MPDSFNFAGVDYQKVPRYWCHANGTTSFSTTCLNHKDEHVPLYAPAPPKHEHTWTTEWDPMLNTSGEQMGVCKQSGFHHTYGACRVNHSRAGAWKSVATQITQCSECGLEKIA